jgi:NCS1 family nucleobase:cation symporter-1
VFLRVGEADRDDQSFWALFGPGLAANVGYWITLSMNIPDFTRYARTSARRSSARASRCPLTMTGFSFIGNRRHVRDGGLLRRGDLGPGHACRPPARRSADPARHRDVHRGRRADLDQHGGQRRLAVERLLQPVAAADLVPDRRPDHRGDRDHLLPWKLYEDVGAYIFTWLVGYGSLLRAFLAVMVFDYWLLRRTRLEIDELYRSGPGGRYWFTNGYNVRALIAVAVGVIPVLPASSTRPRPRAGSSPTRTSSTDLQYGVFVRCLRARRRGRHTIAHMRAGDPGAVLPVGAAVEP